MQISQKFVFKTLFLFFITTFNFTVLIAVPHYFGNIFYFLTLCLLINFLLYFSFIKSKYFFNIFFSIFILLGFGFKFTLSLIFLNQNLNYSFSNPLFTEGGMFRILSQKLLVLNNCNFNEIVVSSFKSNIPSLLCNNVSKIVKNAVIYDNGIFFSIIGILSILLSMIIFEKITKSKCNYDLNINFTISRLYEKLRYPLLFVLFFSIIFVSYINLEISIYQRGITFSSNFPPILRHLVTWLLLFGLSSFICILLYYEYLKGTKIFKIFFFISFLEPFFSSISMLSRGFIFNASSLFFGYLKLIKKVNPYYLSILLSLIILLLMISIKTTQKLRSDKFINYEVNNSNLKNEKLINNKTSKFFNLNLESNKVNFVAQVLIERKAK